MDQDNLLLHHEKKLFNNGMDFPDESLPFHQATVHWFFSIAKEAIDKIASFARVLPPSLNSLGNAS